jgi:hypothetical protein
MFLVRPRWARQAGPHRLGGVGCLPVVHRHPVSPLSERLRDRRPDPARTTRHKNRTLTHLSDFTAWHGLAG